MKRTLPLILLASAALPGLAPARGATPVATATATITPEGGTLNLTTPGAPLESLSYEQARQMFRIREQVSPATARANVGAIAGSVVEMQGEVAGMMATNKGRIFMMRVDGSLATFAVAQKFTNFETLRSGAKARVLVEVGDDAGFTIVAATPRLLDTSLPVAEAPDPIQVAEPAPTPPHDDVIIVPPMVTMTAPGGRTVSGPAPSMSRVFTPGGSGSAGSVASRVTAPTVPATATARPMSSGPLSEMIAAQKPAYKNIVRRYNNRLTDAQVDEIATGLLSAGYQHRLDPRFLAAVVSVESNFDIYSRSRSGAMGLGQLMPFKAAELGVDAYNPTQNLFGMARTLRAHLDTFGRFGERAPLLAVAAYNAGPNAVKRAGYNVPPGEQVQKYVWKVYYAYKSLAPDMFK